MTDKEKKAKKVIEKLSRQCKCLIESPYGNGDPNGSQREQLDALQTALSLFEEVDILRKEVEIIRDELNISNKDLGKIVMFIRHSMFLPENDKLKELKNMIIDAILKG